MTTRDLDNVDAWRTPTASQAAGMTLAAAWRMIAAAESIARETRIALSVAVVDSGDQLVAFARMDGADLVSIDVARNKAFFGAHEQNGDPRPGAARYAGRRLLWV